MSNVLSGDKKQQVIALGKLGWSLRRIERETGVRRNCRGLPESGRRDGAPAGLGTPSAIGVTTDSGAPSVTGQGSAAPPKLSASTCEAYRERIEQGLARGRNAVAIWQDLVTDHGFTGRYQTVQRFVRQLRGTPRPEAAGIILTSPGEERQVDYGSGPMVRDPQSGKYVNSG